MAYASYYFTRGVLYSPIFRIPLECTTEKIGRKTKVTFPDKSTCIFFRAKGQGYWGQIEAYDPLGFGVFVGNLRTREGIEQQWTLQNKLVSNTFFYDRKEYQWKDKK